MVGIASGLEILASADRLDAQSIGTIRKGFRSLTR